MSNETNNQPNVFIHNRTKKFYKIVGEVDGLIVTARIPDGYEVRHSEFELPFKLREATEEEVMKLNTVLPHIPATKQITIDEVNEIYERVKNKSAVVKGKPGDIITPESGLGVIVFPKDDLELDNMVLYKDTISSIKMGLNKIEKKDLIAKVWNRSEASGRMVLNFYGKPGTGKTMAAQCIAKKLGKPLYQVDYSQIISKFVGDTAKHIKQVFDEAKSMGCVLFWDEADSLMSKRVSMEGGGNESGGTSINQNRNVLMQELDRYDGVVIMTSNFFQNYDEALLRRIAQHVEFKLPDATMRETLIKTHFKTLDRMKDVDYEEIAELSEGFSGGDIKVLVENSEDKASLADNPDEWMITQEILVEETNKIKRSKEVHGGSGRTRSVLGFHRELMK